MWSDKTKVEIFGTNLNFHVWMGMNAELHPKKTIPTVKNGGVNGAERGIHVTVNKEGFLL